MYLPLLLKYFSEEELRQLTLHVLELHKLPPRAAEGAAATAATGRDVQGGGEEPALVSPPSLLSLPPEVLLHILSYLSPQELISLVPLHSMLYHLMRDPSLWLHLHPVRWNAGHWKFFKPPQVHNQVQFVVVVVVVVVVVFTPLSTCIVAILEAAFQWADRG